MTERKLVYKFKTPDPRNYIYNAVFDGKEKTEIATITMPAAHTTKIVSKITSTKDFKLAYLPPIIDQSNLGDCVANAFSYCISSQTKNNLSISRLYLYVNSRILDNTPLNNDNGTTIQTACNAIKNYGAVKETTYPYVISNFSKFPSLSIYQNAKLFRNFTYTFVRQNLTSLKNCLNTYNIPIIFGFAVYSSFMTDAVAKTGNVPMPDTKTEQMLGGHCMCIVGYNDATSMFLCANSWGTSWGNKGYCNLPYTYLLDKTLATDFCFTQYIF
jgi:C1A family cysteine protease